jgi:thioredoxin 1
MASVHVNADNFESEVKKCEQPVLIDFWAPWCGPCQMMGPVFEQLSAEYKGKVKFAKVNTDEDQDLAGQFSVSGIPCLILAEKGEEKGRIVGFMAKDALKKRIDSLL